MYLTLSFEGLSISVAMVVELPDLPGVLRAYNFNYKHRTIASPPECLF
jgi:hypothetical protein